MPSFEQTHPPDGHLNSTASHGTKAPCTVCDGNPSDLEGVMDGCQWVNLTGLLDKGLSGAQGRFAAYRSWHKMMNVFGIRIEPPDCVLEGVQHLYGKSQTGFNAGDNPCRCQTCGEIADELYEKNVRILIGPETTLDI